MSERQKNKFSMQVKFYKLRQLLKTVFHFISFFKSSLFNTYPAMEKGHMLFVFKLSFCSIFITLAGVDTQVRAQAFDWAVHMGGTTADCGGSATTLDKLGNVYIIGEFSKTVDFDPGAGVSQLTAMGSRDIYLSKYTHEGKFLWANRILGGSANAYGLVVDATGKINIVGQFTKKVYFNTNAGLDSLTAVGSYAEIFFAQYNENGAHLWTKHLKGDGRLGSKGGGTSGGRGIAVDRTGNIYLTGHFSGTVDFDPGPGTDTITSVTNTTNKTNLFIAKYTSDGAHIWARGVGGNSYVQGADIAIDTLADANNIYITGVTTGTIDFDPGAGVASLSSAGGSDVFVAKYDALGQYVWAIAMGGGGSDHGKKIALGRSGDVFITGEYTGSGDFDPGQGSAILTGGGLYEGFVAKYDSNAQYLWAGSISGNSNGAIVYPNGLSLDGWDNLYVTGTFFLDGVDFDPGPDTAILYPAIADAFLVKYNTCGQFAWAGRMGALASNAGTDVANASDVVVSPQGTAYVTGGHLGNVDFDPNADTVLLTATGKNDVFLLALAFVDTPATVSYLTVSVCAERYTFEGTEYTSSGIYTKILPGIAQCDSTVILDLTLSAPLDPVINVDGFTLGVVGTYTTYQWLKDNLPLPGAIEDSYTVTENGAYQVVVTNEAGCVDTSEVYLVDNYTDIEIIAGQQEIINIYPNPSYGQLYVQSPVLINVQLIDVSGRLVAEKKRTQSTFFSNLSKGIYYVRISDMEGRVISYKKIVRL